MESEITVKLDVRELTVDAIAAQIHQHIYEQRDVDESIRKAVAAEVEKLVSATAKKAIEKRIAAAIDDVFTNGWKKTDEYGREQGKTVTVRDMVLGYLTATDRYSSSGQWMEKTAKELFSQFFAKELDT